MMLTSACFDLTVFQNCRDNRGTYHPVQWDAFANRLLQKKEVRPIKDGKAFAPTKFCGNGLRAKDNVEEISMLVLDIDNGMTLSEAFNIWECVECKFVIYSSYSHQRVTERHPKAEDCFRLVIPLKWPIPVTKFYLLRKWANEFMFGNIDGQTNDPSRMYYLPAIASQNAPFETKICNDDDCTFFDWKKLDLDRFEEKRPSTPSLPSSTPVTLSSNVTSQNYVESALASEINNLLCASEGNRNAQLNKAAYALGQLVASGLVSELKVRTELHSAAKAIGLNDNEILSTINSGLKGGRSSPRNVQLKHKPTLPAFSKSKAPWKLDPDIEKAWQYFWDKK